MTLLASNLSKKNLPELFIALFCYMFLFLVGSNAAKPNTSIVETRVHNYNSLARHVNLEYFKEIVYG